MTDADVMRVGLFVLQRLHAQGIRFELDCGGCSYSRHYCAIEPDDLEAVERFFDWFASPAPFETRH